VAIDDVNVEKVPIHRIKVLNSLALLVQKYTY
jgi:hypothetical protein